MKKDIPAQIVYDFDLQNVLSVRGFDASENIFSIEFQRAPRKISELRISVTPMIRTLRKRLVPVSDLDTREMEYVSPEKYYHLNLRADVPLDGFLIVAPSPEASAPMSLGSAFMLQDGPVEKLEDILLIIPQAMRRPEKSPQTHPASMPAP